MRMCIFLSAFSVCRGTLNFNRKHRIGALYIVFKFQRTKIDSINPAQIEGIKEWFLFPQPWVHG